MAKRKNKLDDAFLGIAIVIAGIAWIAGKVTDPEMHRPGRDRVVGSKRGKAECDGRDLLSQ
jgi:hypothetical protein